MKDRTVSRQQRRRLERQNKKLTDEFGRVPESNWWHLDEPEADKRIEVWRNNRFLVQIFEGDDYWRLSVNRTELGPDGDWLDGIKWEELQAIKSAVGFGNFRAYEVYPEDHQVMDDHMLRHLFVPKNITVSFGWRFSENRYLKGSENEQTK